MKTVDEYLAAQADEARSILEQVRRAIRKAVPEAEETISYKMPTYKLDGQRLLFFAGWKQHFSLYPAGDRLVTEFRDELAPYKVEKSTVRFPLARPVPFKLIERIAKFRAKEISARK
jgi:uncharacterized protein YdhG (YjbR/CyaY superfamily)